MNKVCTSNSKATKAGEGNFFDLTTITAPKDVDVTLQKTICHMIVDQYTFSTWFANDNI